MIALSKLAAQPWLMEPNWFRVACNILAREDPTAGLEGAFKEKIQKRALSLGDGGKEDLRFVERRGDVGILHIRGPIVRYGGMMELSADVRSLESYAKEFKALESDPKVKTIILNIDSPGGEAAGISQFADYVRNANKEVVAYVDDLAASAAYWIAAAAKRIYAAPTAFVGSIGVVFTMIDDSRRQEKEGIERIEIVSTLSPKKRPDIKTKEGQEQIQRWADDLAAKFIAAVAQYRGVSEEEVIQRFGAGDLLIAERAKAVGMIDEIATFEEVVNKVRKGGSSMNIEEFQASHPKLFEEVFALGAKAERERIAAIEALGEFKGYEEIVKAMKFDGKSSAEDVELAIFREQRKRMQHVASSYEEDGEQAAALLAEAGVGGMETNKKEGDGGALPKAFEKVLQAMKGGK